MENVRREESSDAHSLDDKKDLSFNSSKVEAVQYNKGVDEAVDLVAGHAEDASLDPVEARRIRNKIDWVILPLLFALYTLQALDKGTLGASAVLGIITDNHLTANQFNTLGSAFYIGYIAFEYAHSWALQRFPVAKYLAINLFLWAVFIGLHAVCKNFAGLFVLRFLLGATEGCITSGVMLITSMFYTRTEIAQRIGWTFQCNGLALIISGFLSFGVGHADPKGKPNRWQLLMIIYAGLTLIITVWFAYIFPDSPVKARFLTKEEKIKAVQRIQGNQSGVETKTWKRSQFIEALTDVKTWLFFFFAAISNLQNGYSIQYGPIIQSFGFTVLQTTLLNIPVGVLMIISITSATFVLRRFPNSRSLIAVVYFIPSAIGAIMLMAIPFKHHGALLAGYYVLNIGGAASFVMAIAWVTVTTAGHTKKLTVNGIFLIGYALGQILCTQFWKAQYKPRNLVPWAICLASYVADIILLLTIRYVLQAENKRRDALQAAAGSAYEEHGYVERTDDNGQVIRQKVDRGLLDLTDRENLSFRYVL